MFSSPIWSSLLFGAVLPVCVGLVHLSVIWTRKRRFYKNLPCPPHSFLFGHLKVLGEVMQTLPKNVHPQVAMAIVREKYNLPHVFYMDLWPIATSLLMIQDPDIAAQITQTKNHPKHTLNKEFLRNMTGEQSIVTSEGAEWRKLRSMLGPAFSSNHLSTLVPDITDHVLKFRGQLQELVKSEKIVRMQDLACNLTIDVISQIVLGRSFNSQTTFSSITYDFRKSISWAGTSMDIISRNKSRLPIWWYCRRLDRELTAEIQERHAGRATTNTTTASKAVVDLVFQAYQDEKLGLSTSKEAQKPDVDPEFMLLAVNNIKTLLLGGHDTTATTIAYTYYLLSQHPDILSAIRSEHSTAFSPSIKTTASLLESGQASKLLSNSNLPFTTAVIKEVLRLFPTGSTIRMSSDPATETLSYQSQSLPLTNHALWISHYGIAHREDLFPDPAAFDPYRFMPGKEVPRDAWRPFEKGPRNCVGMELAMLEIKAVLALTLREFDFESVYGRETDGERGLREAPERHGGRAYQMIAFAPKPAGGMPMRVRLRAGSEKEMEKEG
ncbi:hypothetical protein GJ744_003514 [Endocarpon pusillum]|uniref:Cytochrome P450 n=1 Tax=Endocarpon pusillum TaxID=364733 RepID=A0A8H7E856_9EURO|nr:hypothetical protein GJ744_003514 [Endocarpon pusillum]